MNVRLVAFSLMLGLTTYVVQAYEPPDKLVPLYRFYDRVRNEHVYTHREEEADIWRKIATVDEHCVVGLVSPELVPGTIRLWRAIRASDGKHYHYTKAPGKAEKLTVEEKVFEVYVWKARGDGRVPVHSSTWTDGTDTFFERDSKILKRFSSDTKKALGVVRPEQGLVFWVYPSPTEEKTKDTESK